MAQRTLWYRSLVAAIGVGLLFMAASGYIGHTINAFYFPDRPNPISRTRIFLFAGSGVLFILEALFIPILKGCRKWLRKNDVDEA